MIERMSIRIVSQLGRLPRSSIVSSKPISTSLCLRQSPPRLYPVSLQRTPRRFYAPHTPHSYNPPLPQDPQPFQREPSDLPLPVYFPPPPPKRRIRNYVYATIFFVFGATVGSYVRFIIHPFALPEPGTPEDATLTAHIRSRATRLPIVQSLSTDPQWTSWDAYSTFTPEEKEHRITAGALGGARGLGAYQHIFHNASTGEFITVLHIGGVLAGWPGVAHGGLIATVLDESMGRCAVARFPVQTGMTAKLEFKYLKPTVTNDFCVIRAKPVEEGSTATKGYVEGQLEDMEGRVCVTATGLFVLPKKVADMSLKPIELKVRDNEKGEGF